ncbi:MAG: hypothetical protein DHS20C11_00860 [Lysobacteraceae bacterium]|nr:MAG: hypothetical protein DHS20C11_00860 [Xanthomonadaceae bacterium]
MESKHLLGLGLGLALLCGGAQAVEWGSWEQRLLQPAERTGLDLLLVDKQQGMKKAGDFRDVVIETGHPYAVGSPSEKSVEMVWSRTIHEKNASFIMPHFLSMDLAEGDFLVLRSPDNSRERIYTGYGKSDRGRPGAGGFWGIHISGDTAILELYSSGKPSRHGVLVDRISVGFPDFDTGGGSTRSLCTVDDSENSTCYADTHPFQYQRAQTVARLLITKPTGTFFCTGWLVGSEGHFITNQHCIENGTQAMDTTFEFAAEGATCATNCRTGNGCPGVVEADNSTLIKVSSPLDYALVAVDTSGLGGTDLPATYGFLTLRPGGAELLEEIYIPQHPAGWGKHIALTSSYPSDVNLGGMGYVQSVTEFACTGGTSDVGYFLDTQGGSSGSPVLASADHAVVALHHCRGSAFCASGNPATDDPNRGVPIEDVIAHIDADMPADALWVDEYFVDSF